MKLNGLLKILPDSLVGLSLSEIIVSDRKFADEKSAQKAIEILPKWAIQCPISEYPTKMWNIRQQAIADLKKNGKSFKDSKSQKRISIQVFVFTKAIKALVKITYNNIVLTK